MNSKLLFYFSVLIIALLTISCFKKEEELEQVRIGSPRSLLTSLLWLAEEKGYFKAEGLKIHIQDYVSGKRALNAFLRHEVDLVITAEAPFVLASFKYPELRLFASIGSSDNEVRLVARRDSNITKPEDLKGKRIATQKGSAVHFFLDSFLLYHGIHHTEFEAFFYKGEMLPKALVEGEIDAFAMRDPYLQQAKDLLGEKIIEFSQPGLYTKSYNLVGDSIFAKKKSIYVHKILRALIKAQAFSQKNPREAINLIAQIQQIPITRVRKIWPEMILRVSMKQSLLLTLEEESQWAIQTKLVKGEKIHNILSFLDSAPLTTVNADAVGIFSTVH